MVVVVSDSGLERMDEGGGREPRGVVSAGETRMVYRSFEAYCALCKFISCPNYVRLPETNDPKLTDNKNMKAHQ